MATGAGWPGSGELNGDTNPYELGLTSWVSFSKAAISARKRWPNSPAAMG